MWHHYSWAGIKRKDPIATFGYHPIIHVNSKKPPFWLYDRVENELFFSIQHISAQTAPLYIQALIDFRPVMIRGVPSFLNLIAQHMLETGKTYHPKGIFTNSETLVDLQRKAIGQAFGCPVYNFYSNGERMGHVLQCQLGNLHVLTETSILEVLHSDGNLATVGEVGELVITSLINRAMPLIRYRIGDTAIMGEGRCSCGRDTPILKNLTGRSDDFIVKADGRRIHPLNVFLVTQQRF
jgi:phenylacetate-CoA ligase